METIINPAMPPSGSVAAVSPSAVSASAIISGALVAASATLVLTILGAGFGFASLSPWPHNGASATTFAVTTAIGLILVQWISAALGGYITGRLRTKWVSVHTHEVFFRDTAHGLITWALATLLIAAAAVGIAMSGAAGASHAAGMAATVAASRPGPTSGPGPVHAYEADVLLRPSSVPAASSGSDSRAETTRILGEGLVNGNLSPEDRAYLAQLVTAQTGVSASDAQARIDALLAKRAQADTAAREAADKARSAAEEMSLFTAFSMLVGAFIACVSAALGGHLRDLHP